MTSQHCIQLSRKYLSTREIINNFSHVFPSYLLILFNKYTPTYLHKDPSLSLLLSTVTRLKGGGSSKVARAGAEGSRKRREPG